MKRLLQIVIGGTVLFVLVAMAQEWQVFARPFLGSDAALPSLPEADRRAAADTVHDALRLMQHLYSSAGDVRFAQRLPVSEVILEEIEADLAFVARSDRVQVLELAKLDVTDVTPLDPRHVEIRTRELWSVRYRQLDGTPFPEPTRIEVTHGRYLVGREGSSWRIDRWEVLDLSEGDAT